MKPLLHPFIPVLFSGNLELLHLFLGYCICFRHLFLPRFFHPLFYNISFFVSITLAQISITGRKNPIGLCWPAAPSAFPGTRGPSHQSGISLGYRYPAPWRPGHRLRWAMISRLVDLSAYTLADYSRNLSALILGLGYSCSRRVSGSAAASLGQPTAMTSMISRSSGIRKISRAFALSKPAIGCA